MHYSVTVTLGDRNDLELYRKLKSWLEWVKIELLQFLRDSERSEEMTIVEQGETGHS